MNQTTHNRVAKLESAPEAAEREAWVGAEMRAWRRSWRSTAALMQSLHPIAQTVTSPPRVLVENDS